MIDWTQQHLLSLGMIYILAETLWYIGRGK